MPQKFADRRHPSVHVVTAVALLSSLGGATSAFAQPDAQPPPSGHPDAGASVTPLVAPFAETPAAASDLPLGQASDVDVTTGIRGRVVDARTNQGIRDAPVLAQGAGQTGAGVTDAQGNFTVHVPAGTYVVRAHAAMYHGARIARIRVTRARLTPLTLVLDAVNEADDVVVEELEIPYRADTSTAAAQLQLRQASTGIGEGMGADQMSQAGASDASSAAARVVGVSIESDQLVIRGLSGRYNRVLLNGVAVPSVDPDVPGVDLDLFPTSIIDSLTVSKTFLPDMPADFAGGVMEIRSVSFPRKFTLDLGLSTGFSSQSTFRDRLDYKGASLDVLGFGSGARAIPAQVRERTRAGSLSEQEAESFGSTWQYTRKAALPKLGADITVGDSRTFAKKRRFGYLVTAGYDVDSIRKMGRSRPNPGVGMGGELVERNTYRTELGADEVQLSSLATASLDVGADHSLTALSLWNRSAADETTLQLGTSASEGPIEKWQLQYLARTLWFNQILGDHRNLGGTRLRLRWAAFHAYGERDEPDRRTVAYGNTRDAYEWLDTTASGTRFFSNLRQDDLGGNLALRLPLWAEAWANVGGSAQVSTRDFSNRRFRMRKHRDNRDGTAYRRPVEELFGAEGIGTLAEMQDATRDNDSYASQQELYAGYLLIEAPIWGRLSFAGGARAEVAVQHVASRSPFPGRVVTDGPKTDRTDVDYLPGGAFKYQLSRTMILRAAYGLTVARPQIRELAPYDYYDFLRDRGVVGNPQLKRTRIHNADLRWEWFFADGQVLAASAFFKEFRDPIELAVLDNVSGSSQFRNGTRARNIGAEVELRLGLGHLARALRWFTFDGNVSLIRSRIELPAELTAVRSNRPLAGQSPYVANVALRFNEDNQGVTAALVYNVVGPRISDVATLLGDVIPPDIEESALHSLDFVGSVKAGPHMKVKLKLRNLLYQRRELWQGNFLIQRADPGISASLGLSINY